VNGTCTVVCNPGFQNCDGNGANGCETDTSSSATNCGACGHVCPTGGACVAGQCTCPPAAPLACNGTCVNPTVDPANCGQCGHVCAPGHTCVAGSCV
jgi:hypothetical protein